MTDSGHRLASDIVAQLRSSGFSAYLVGGCVRDLLLGVEPKDFDVATSALPEQVLALYPGALRVGAHFGVVLVRGPGAAVEVATYRSDHAYEDGRHPGEVRFETTPREDVLRRDFTINALMLDPESGEILDEVGGRQDLTAGIVRAIGDPETRFREDHLRMLRAVRFAARLGFSVDPATAGAIRSLADRINLVSAERIRDEVARILTEGGARRGFELLDETGLLEQVLPEVSAMKGVAQPPEFHPEGDVWEHTLIMLDGLDHPSLTLALGVLLHDVGKPPTYRVAERIRFDGHVEAGVAIAKDILGRMRVPNDDTEQVLALIANHMRFKDVPHMKDSTLKRMFRMKGFDEHLELHRLDCESSHRMLGNYEYAKAKLAEFGEAQISPPRLVNGTDLIQAGYTPGPDFGRILNAVEDAQLEGRVTTREQALDLARRLATDRAS